MTTSEACCKGWPLVSKTYSRSWILSLPGEATPDVNTCSATMFGRHARGSPTDCFECHPARLPVHPMSESSGGRREPHRVRRNHIGLDHILPILVLRLAPAADFNVHFAGRAAYEYGGRLQMGDIVHHKSIGSISQASRQLHFRARPPPELARRCGGAGIRSRLSTRSPLHKNS